ncbi:hypothetical protein ABIB73_000254 [Bradyrhizobium sp. F1.4.3]|uniref:hypothetical protein n=1 Tax=Bradyrhizobium sp. F1.4.3 TaxID=3156356 RepID=UPI0033987E1D
MHPTAVGYNDEAGVVFNVISAILNNIFTSNDHEPLPIEHDNGTVTKVDRLFRDREAANDNRPALAMVG